MKKLLILSFYYEPDLSAGSFRITALVNEILKHDAFIDVVTTMPNRYSSFDVDASLHETNGRLKVNRIKIPSHNSGIVDQIRSFAVFYLKALKLTKNEDYDLVFATSSRLFTAFLGSRIAKNKRIPLYLDVRDIFLDTIKDIISPKLLLPLSPLLDFFEKSSFSKANKINLVSRGFLNYFNSRYPNMSYSFYTNGIDKEFLDFDFQKTIKKDPNRKITVTYAGNIGEGQGLHKILPNLAMYLQDDVHFKIVGDGGKRSYLEEIISKKNIKNIELIAPMNREKLKQEYKKSDLLFLHLNDYDAFKKVLPSKLFEYASTGKPIWAGLSGYSAKFCLSEIENCKVFKPSDYKDALLKFTCIDFHHTPRKQFIKKYKRQNIMENIANEVMTIIRKNEQ